MLLKKKSKVEVVSAKPKPVVEVEEVEEEEAPRVKLFDASYLAPELPKLLKYSTFEPKHRYWLDTGYPELNAALGSREHGLPYGKMFEIRGKAHGGKTTLSLLIGGMAQQDGAAVGYLDLEDSRDDMWSNKLGLDYSKVLKLYPKLVHPKASAAEVEERPAKKGAKKKKLRSKGGLPYLQSAEEVCAEVEASMALLADAGAKKQFWIIDSVANLMAEEALVAGAEGANMRTKLSRASLLAMLLPTWTALAANYNAMIFLINQVRTNPSVMFGDPTYSPGGNAFTHTCAVRVEVARIKNGRMKKVDKVVGLVAEISNFKNKAGRGSEQDMSCGFYVKWNVNPAKYEFMSVKDATEWI